MLYPLSYEGWYGRGAVYRVDGPEAASSPGWGPRGPGAPGARGGGGGVLLHLARLVTGAGQVQFTLRTDLPHAPSTTTVTVY